MQGFVFRLIPPRPDFATTMTPAERTTMEAHVSYWTGLMGQGRVVAFGPVLEPGAPYGLGIITRRRTGGRRGDPRR